MCWSEQHKGARVSSITVGVSSATIYQHYYTISTSICKVLKCLELRE